MTRKLLGAIAYNAYMAVTENKTAFEDLTEAEQERWVYTAENLTGALLVPNIEEVRAEVSEDDVVVAAEVARVDCEEARSAYLAETPLRCLALSAAAEQEIYEYFAYLETWRVYPLCDRTDVYWKVIGGAVWFANTEEELGDSEQDEESTYKDEIALSRCDSGIWRAAQYTMIRVDTQTDGNVFLAIFANDMERPEKEKTEFTLCEKVYAALDNAKHNGYDLSGGKDTLDIAIDLCTCSSDLESEEPEELEPYIKQWQEEQS